MNLKGIDVSKHQGNIDWNKVKNDGIQFAMLRAGIGDNIASQDDPTFERNVKECERVGIPWGAYLYSYALNEKQAKSEANHILRLLKGKNPQFPVAFDMEDADNYKANNGMPTNHALVNFCDTFLDTVEKAGYYATLYASLGWLNGKLNSSKLNRYDKWVAQWNNNKESSYNGSHQMWQYASDGNVNGISGHVDMNKAYTNFIFGKNDKTYKIKSGDTLSQIAVNHNTTTAKLLLLNPSIKNADNIFAGQKIKVPK